MNRRKKTAINLLTSSLSEVIVIIYGLIVPRMILGAFGSTYNGVISSATQMLSLISILTLGIAGAVRAELYHTLAHHDHDGTSRIMKAANTYMRKVGIALLAFAGILMLIFPYISHSDIPHKECVFIIGIVAVDSFCLYFFGTSNYSLLVADQKGYIKDFLNIIAKILTIIVIWLLLRSDANIFEVKGSGALINTLVPIGVALYVVHHYHLNKHCQADMNALKKRNDAAIHSLANIVHDNTDTLILTLFLDIKYVSVYTVYYAVVGKIKTLIKSASTAIEAAFGDMWAKKEIDTLQKSFRGFEYAISLIVVIIFSCIGVMLIPFIELYTSVVSDINYIRVDFALLITAAEAIFCIRQPYRSLVHATGFFKETKNAAIIEAILNLAVSIPLVLAIGINGVVIGTLIANLYRTLSYARFVSKNVLKRSLKTAVVRMLWACAGLVLSVAIGTTLIHSVPIVGWLGWIIKGIITFGQASMIALLMSLLFYRKDMLEAIKLLKGRRLKRT